VIDRTPHIIAGLFAGTDGVHPYPPTVFTKKGTIMKKSIALFITVATLVFTSINVVPHGVAGATALLQTDASAIKKEVLGQGTSAISPDRVLLLQRRTFAPGSDSGAHPAPGPTVLYVDSGVVEFTVTDGAALLTRHGSTTSETVAAGDEVDLNQGDAVFYDQGVVHDVANSYDSPAVTLEARFNPNETTAATPAP
jgi:quercetin dioxygenase-like cupin family protein